MPTAFVLVNSELSYDMEIIGKMKDILSSNKDLEYEIQGVYGIYDIVLRVSSEDGSKLRQIITNKIRKIDKVQSTLTMMVIEEQE
ncbi:MAG: Lrp/AsnC ligand binding domain-containing protein [Thermoproteota archaeon]|nr:Lrp/AsnC ligand binding domain-containing protein [Thermoproteota archaeon]